MTDSDNPMENYLQRFDRYIEAGDEAVRRRRGRSTSPPARRTPSSHFPPPLALEDDLGPPSEAGSPPTTPDLFKKLQILREAMLNYTEYFSRDLTDALNEFWTVVNTTLDPELNYEDTEGGIVFDPKTGNLRLGVSLALGGYILLLSEIHRRGFQSLVEYEGRIKPTRKVGQEASATYLRALTKYVGKWVITDTSAQRHLSPSGLTSWREGPIFLVNLAIVWSGPLLEFLGEAVKKTVGSEVIEKGVGDIIAQTLKMKETITVLDPDVRKTILIHGGGALVDVSTSIAETVKNHLDDMANYSYFQLLPYAALGTLAVLNFDILPRSVQLPLTWVQYASHIYIWWDLSSSSGMADVLKGYCVQLRTYVDALGSVDSSLVGRAAHFETIGIRTQGSILVAQIEAFLSETRDYGGWLWILLWATVILFMILIAVSHYRAYAARRRLDRDATELADLADSAYMRITGDSDYQDSDYQDSDYQDSLRKMARQAIQKYAEYEDDEDDEGGGINEYSDDSDEGE